MKPVWTAVSAAGAEPVTACFMRVSSRSSWMSVALMRPILPVTSVIFGLPARDRWDGSDPPRRCGACENSACQDADPGGKKGGSLPSTSDFPDRHGGAGNMAVTH